MRVEIYQTRCDPGTIGLNNDRTSGGGDVRGDSLNFAIRAQQNIVSIESIACTSPDGSVFDEVYGSWDGSGRLGSGGVEGVARFLFLQIGRVRSLALA